MRNEREIGDRLLEVFAAMLLGLATVATAWCAYQSSQWNDRETDASQESAQHRLEASRLFAFGTQKVSYDATIAALYAQALAQDQEELLAFYRSGLVRPEFLPQLEAWEDAAAAGEDLENLFDNQEYLDAEFSASREADAAAEASIQAAREASDNAADFIQTTIFLASALFFAGVTANFRSRSVRMLLLFMATVVFAVGIARIADLPIA